MSKEENEKRQYLYVAEDQASKFRESRLGCDNAYFVSLVKGTYKEITGREPERVSWDHYLSLNNCYFILPNFKGERFISLSWCGTASREEASTIGMICSLRAYEQLAFEFKNTNKANKTNNNLNRFKRFIKTLAYGDEIESVYDIG